MLNPIKLKKVSGLQLSQKSNVTSGYSMLVNQLIIYSKYKCIITYYLLYISRKFFEIFFLNFFSSSSSRRFSGDIQGPFGYDLHDPVYCVALPSLALGSLVGLAHLVL